MHRLLLLLLPLLLAVAGLAASDHAPIERPFLHGLFTDHMVLQREMPCPVWGWTTPGATVTVTLAGTTATATASADGAWQARLGPLPPGGPHVLSVTGPQQVTLSDVLVGDKWETVRDVTGSMARNTNGQQKFLANSGDVGLNIVLTWSTPVRQPDPPPSTKSLRSPISGHCRRPESRRACLRPSVERCRARCRCDIGGDRRLVADPKLE